MCKYKNLLITTLFILIFQSSYAAPYALHSNDSRLSREIKENIQSELDSLLQSRIYKTMEKQHAELAEKTAIQQIKTAIQPFGYYQAKITANRRNFYIQLGPRTLIRHINLQIVGPGRQLLIKKIQRLPLNTGAPLIISDYEKAKQLLIEKAEKKGYIKSHFNKNIISVDLACHCADITLIFDTGDRYFFGQVNFSKTFFAHNFLLRYAPFKIGSPYSSEKLIKFEQNLSGSPYFNRVDIRPNIDSNKHIPLQVDLTPKASQQYTLGLGYGTDTGARGRAGLELLNINPYGHTLQFGLQASQRQNSLQTNYVIPGKNPVYEQINLSANIYQLDYPVGNSNDLLFSITKISNHKKIQYDYGLNFLYERFSYNQRPKGEAYLLYPSLNFTIIHRSSPLFSKQGYRININGQGSYKDLFSNQSFLQANLLAKWAIWLSPTHTRFLLQSQMGQTFTNDLFKFPLSLQLLLGGSQNLTAYSYQSIGPGKRLLLGSIEIQQETIKDWFVTVFTDAGDVYKPEPLAWKKSIGAGLMYVSPIGPIKVGVARALDREGKPFKLVFSMGPDL